MELPGQVSDQAGASDSEEVEDGAEVRTPKEPDISSILSLLSPPFVANPDLIYILYIDI